MEKQNVKVLSRAEMKKLKGGDRHLECVEHCMVGDTNVDPQKRQIECERWCYQEQTT